MQMSHPTHYYVSVLPILLFFSATTTAISPEQNYFNSITQFLGPQNAARSTLRLPPLEWDQNLANYAEWYASQRQGDCALVHSDGPYGENIFWGSGDDWSPTQAADVWAGERRWYDYWSNSCAEGEECGHYTQIVWSSTRNVGCARVNCDDGRGVFMNCNYYPPGNYVGERPY